MYITQSFYKTLIGITILLLLFYRFFLLQRFPYNIDDTITILKLLLLAFIPLFKVFELVIILKTILHRNTTTTFSTFMSKLVNVFFYNPLEYVGGLLLTLTPVKQLFISLSNFFLFLEITKPMLIIMFLVCYQYLPVLLCSFYLLIDVFLLNKIFLFYKFFYIYIYVLIFRGTLGMLFLSNQQNMLDLEKTYFTVKILPTLSLEFYMKKLTENSEELKLQWVNHYNLLDFLKALHLYRKTSKILLFLQLFIIVLVLIAWSGFIYKVLLCKYLLTITDTSFFSILLKIFIFPW